MNRIIIICEGETEQEFCRGVLYPFFLTKKIKVEYPLIKKSGGGIVHWKALKKQIEKHLKSDISARVTLLIDYYGIQSKHEFPDWIIAEATPNKSKRMEILESGMKAELSDNIAYRFIPNIQLHEFEGLLFNNLEVFTKNFTEDELLDIEELTRTINNNPNPELINNSSINAPSKRLERLIRGYKKVVHGAILAEEIGLTQIRAKSPRFNQWITNLESI